MGWKLFLTNAVVATLNKYWDETEQLQLGLKGEEYADSHKNTKKSE